MKNKIIILGAKGQLGTTLCNLCEKKNLDFKGLDFPDIDITIPETFQKKIIDFKPDILINCAAYTDVYRAERDLERAMLINGISIKHLVDLCNANEIYLCHISTSYVFNGLKQTPYIETDKPNPVNYYGITKYVGEQILCNYSNDYSIVRTADLYGESELNSINVIKKMISIATEYNEIKLVNNEFTSPTFALNLAEQILVIIENKIEGIVHASSEGSCNWVEFGEYLFNQLGLSVNIEEVESAYFNQDLMKPMNSCLDNKKLKDNKSAVMLDWHDALEKYLKEIRI